MRYGLVDLPFTPEEEKTRLQMCAWGKDAVAFVLEVFGPAYLALHGEPLVLDVWQIEFLQALTSWERHYFALAACKGPGKTAAESWAIWWFLATRFDAQVVCTAISGDNLKANLWKELATWLDLAPILQKMFSQAGEAITSKDPARTKTWWCQARSWPHDADPTQQATTFAGLHSKHVMFVVDEAGDVPTRVVAAAEGIFANNVEAYLILGGNTTQTGGPLYDAARNLQGKYWVKRITGDPDDPNRCTRISLQWAKDQIAEHGRDHPWVKINVLGEFPLTQANKFLGPDDIEKAQRRNPKKADYEYEPVIIGIDTADGGADQTAMCRRQGCVMFQIRTWRLNNAMTLAEQIAGVLVNLDPPADAVFVDLGGPSGHGISDRLNQLGFNVIGIDFGSEPIGDDPKAPIFANRRAEMAYKCAKWVKSIGSLPIDIELGVELCEPVYYLPVVNKMTRLLLEPKDEVKKRIGRSPDRGDSAWLTWAAPVAHKELREVQLAMERTRQDEYDPYATLGGRRT